MHNILSSLSLAVFRFFAAEVTKCAPTEQPNSFLKGVDLPFACADPNNLQLALQIFSGLLGAIALLIIVINALRYVVSQGDSTKTAKAKNAILYAVIGLVICISAYAIVTFVLFNVT